MEIDRNEFVSMWMNGLTIREMRRRLGCSHDKISMMAMKLRLPARSAGRILNRPYTAVKYANRNRKPANEEPITYETKKCLRCKNEFPSEGKHNRLCHTCGGYARNAHNLNENYRYAPT